MIGKTILHYKILDKLGEGGMGTVYKAQDTKLDRFVALKFLPSQLTTTEDEKARFIQEAKAASALNHPNVCTIHDIQEFEGQLFIVMEYIDGTTLRDKKENLSEKRILDIAIQVAEGLGAAHEKGIVHRDIKPENIMIRKDGIVQIMDFGLAKLYTDSNVSRLTKAGTTMGTMGYMSPEQVQGLDVDHRSDIFSLGVVLYELLAGESPFKGMHETAIMYEIVNVDAPPIATAKQDIDPQLDGLILECLEKEKDERCQSAKELAKNLRKIKRVSTGSRSSRMFNVNSGIKNTSPGTAQNVNTSGTFSVDILNRRFDLSKFFSPRIIPWILLLISIITIAFLFFTFNQTVSRKAVTKFSINVGKDNSLDINGYRALAISHDGNKIIYSSNGQLYLRKMDQVEPIVLSGAEKGSSPFFSPDDKWVGFFIQKKLEKIPVNGGPLTELADITDNRGGTWGKDGSIVYAPSTTTGLYIIPGVGGEPRQLTFPDSAKNERTHRWPSFLPDGKNILFTVGLLSSPTYYEDATIDVFNIESGERKTILKGASSARYISSGQLIYSKSGALYAVPFDLDNLEVKGQPIPILQDVSGGLTSGTSNFYFSNNGTLIYIQGSNEYTKRNIVKIDMQGKITIIDSTDHIFTEPALSPDNKKIAFTTTDNKTSDIWVFDINRKTSSKLTFGGENRTPKWSPDGNEISYTKLKSDNNSGVFIKPFDGSGKEREIYSLSDRLFVDDWTRDGKYLLCEVLTKNNQTDVIVIPLEEGKKPWTLLGTKFDEYNAKVSPNGKWVLYVSNESGSYQSYARQFSTDDNSGRWQISNDNGEEPIWSPDGKTIYYRANSSNIVAIPVTYTPTITFGIPQTICKNFPGMYTSSWISYDITSDGKYFISTNPVSGEKYNNINIVLNWTEEIDKLFKTE